VSGDGSDQHRLVGLQVAATSDDASIHHATKEAPMRRLNGSVMSLAAAATVMIALGAIVSWSSTQVVDRGRELKEAASLESATALAAHLDEAVLRLPGVFASADPNPEVRWNGRLADGADRKRLEAMAQRQNPFQVMLFSTDGMRLNASAPSDQLPRAGDPAYRPMLDALATTGTFGASGYQTTNSGGVVLSIALPVAADPSLAVVWQLPTEFTGLDGALRIFSQGSLLDLIDGSGRVLASSEDARAGTAVQTAGDARLAAPVRADVSTEGDSVVVRAPMTVGWTVVATTPREQFYGSLDSLSQRNTLLLSLAGLAVLLALTASSYRRRRTVEVAAAASAHAASHDNLTGLLNRAGLESAIAQAKSKHERFSLLYLDLDSFKPVNDTLGHAAGDELLALVARRIRGCLRSTDLGARLGGDEFMVVAFDLEQHDADALAQRLRDVIAQPYPLAAGEARVSASVGIASGSAGEDYEELLQRADAAMYQSKQSTDPAGGRRLVGAVPGASAEN
jgi:diguanylate cyclase (GGDEF)-like protein